MVHSHWNGVSGNISRQLCWWADLGGENGDSLLTGGKMVYPLGKSPREAGFLFSGDYGNLIGGGRAAKGPAWGGGCSTGIAEKSCFAKTFASGLTYSSTVGLEMCFLLFVRALIYVFYL